MDQEKNTIVTASFNPGIKKYIFWVVAFFMLVTILGIPLLIIWLFGVGQVISRRYYENLSCKLTSDNLDFKKGVFFRVEKTIPLENIQDLTFVDNPLLQALDLRILKVETAGHSNSKGSDMTLIGIKDAAQFKQQVLEQRARIKQNPGLEEGNIDLEILQTLKDIKASLIEIKNK